MEPEEVAALKKKQAEMAQAMRESAAESALADTNITITNQPAPRPAAPRFAPSQPAAVSPAPAPVATTIGDSTRTNVTYASTGTHIENRPTINWGKVAKGALIVGAVVLVAVVAAPMLAEAIMASETLAPLVVSTGEALVPVANVVGQGVGMASVALESAASAAWSGVTSGAAWLGDAAGITQAGGEAIAASKEAVAATTASLKTTFSALAIGGGTAAAAGYALTHPDMLHVVGTEQVAVPNTPVAIEHSHDASPSLGTDTAASARLAAASTTQASHLHAAEEIMHAAHHGHHASETAQENATERTSAREAFLRSRQASQAWADRAGRPEVPSGKFTDRVTPKAPSDIKPRHSSFTQELSEKANAMDASLEPLR